MRVDAFSFRTTEDRGRSDPTPPFRGRMAGPEAGHDGSPLKRPYTPPVTSIVTPETKSASADARKQITRA